jgi:hypothetical protein
MVKRDCLKIKSGDLCQLSLIESGVVFIGIVLYKIKKNQVNQYMPKSYKERENIWKVFDFENGDSEFFAWESEISLIQSL